ncbi:hypothetical protein ES703_60531 [subsurface metagenome]
MFTTNSGLVKQLRYLLGEIWELTGYEECFNSFPAIASQVSAFARMYLYELMKVAGWRNYYYCDTDSLIVNKTGLSNLRSYLDDTKLGSLKVQETTQSVCIRGLKDYTTDTKTVVKGIRKNAIQVSDGIYNQEQWPSLKGLLRSGLANTYRIKYITKSLDRKYTKGIVRQDGWIDPLDLADPYDPGQLLF